MKSADTGQNALTSLGAFLEYIKETADILRLSMFCIRQMNGVGRFTRVLSFDNMIESGAYDRTDQLKFLDRMESMASNEVQSGFPMLVSHSLVALWSALEVCISDFCAEWLLLNPDLLKSEPLAKLKISPALLVAESRREVMSSIVAEISRSTDAPMRAGLGRFETILGKVGISVDLDSDVRRKLFELSKIRNVIVHRFGIVDAAFITQCPWRSEKEGERLVVTATDYYHFQKSATIFVGTIIRACENYAKSKNQ